VKLPNVTISTPLGQRCTCLPLVHLEAGMPGVDSSRPMLATASSLSGRDLRPEQPG
jgi:hypothetical protein